MWTLFGEHYLRKAEVEEARKLLPRSLQSLEKRKRESILQPVTEPCFSSVCFRLEDYFEIRPIRV